MDQAAQSELVLTFDRSVCRLTALKKAAYRLGDRCFVQISPIAEERYTVTLRCANRCDIAILAGEFQNEALDQELRELVADETKGVRDLILAQAFSATTLVDPEGESADYRSDPLGIGGRTASRRPNK